MPQQDFQLMPNVGGYKYCAKRDTAYNYLTALKPTKSAAGKWECKDSKMSKLCGTDANKLEHVFCIPSSSDCPLTKISFSDNGILELSTDASNGAALIDLMLSEGGPPCLHDNEYFNSQ
jgi:hypothetical protein